jgi:membrane protein DedA with SNARE-associated domain
VVKKIFFVLGIFCAYMMSWLSYGGIALLMAIESACIPLPSELIMPYAGAMTLPDVNAELARQYGVALPHFNLWIAALAGAIGCNIGSEIAYWVGAKGGRRAIEKYGRYVLMSKHELAIADRWFEKRGEIIILVARILPVIRTFIAFPAGVAKMNRVKFHVYTFVGSLPWCFALGWVGRRLGLELMSEHSPLKAVMHKLDAVIAAVIVLGAVWFVRSRLKALKQYREADRQEAAEAKASSDAAAAKSGGEAKTGAEARAAKDGEDPPKGSKRVAAKETATPLSE